MVGLAAAKLLRLLERGDHPDLTPVLHRTVRTLTKVQPVPT
jgi:hypothetical protein